MGQLPPSIHTVFLDAYAASIDKAFRVAAFVSVAAFVASWFIQEKPMRTTVRAEDVGSSFAVPRSSDSLAEIIRALGVLVGRKQMRAYLQRVASEAGIDLPIAQCLLLVHLRHPSNKMELQTLAARRDVPLEVLESALADLRVRGLVAPASTEDELDEDVELTAAGAAVADDLVTTVRERLERLLEGWSPEQYPDLVNLLNELAVEVVPSRAALRTSAEVGT